MSPIGVIGLVAFLLTGINSLFAAEGSSVAPDDFKLVSQEGTSLTCLAKDLASINDLWKLVIEGPLGDPKEKEIRLNFSKEAVQLILMNAQGLKFQSTFMSLPKELSHELVTYIDMFDDQKLACALLLNSQNEDDIPGAWQELIMKQIAGGNDAVREKIISISGSRLFNILELRYPVRFLKYDLAYPPILHMETWTEDNIDTALTHDNYLTKESLLRESLLSTIVSQMAAKVKNTVQWASFCLAYYTIYNRALYSAACNLAALEFDYQVFVAHQKIENALRNMVGDDIVKNVLSYALAPAIEAIHGSSQKAVEAAMGKLAEAFLYRIISYRSKLSNLYKLTCVSQDAFIDKYFYDAYSFALKELEKETSFHLSTAEMLNVINDHIWIEEHITKNRHILLFKQIVETMACQVQ